MDEYIGGQLQRLAIRFVDPAALGFDEVPGTTHICARVGFSNLPVAFGWLVHQVRPTSDGAEMRSRFALNESPALLSLPAGAQGRHPGYPVLAALESAGVHDLSSFITAPLLPATLGTDMLFHCSQEMSHLASFLPRLIRSSAARRDVRA